MTHNDVRPRGKALGAGTVHVWRVRLDTAARLADTESQLSHDELHRASRFHFDRDRERYVRSHVALRTILSEYAGDPGSHLAFEAGPFGKPALASVGSASRKLEFNLSHSGDWALIAVAAQSVGVDVERWDAAVECLELAEHYFSHAERLALRSLVTGEALTRGFFQAWSRKEAYLKATGMGISDGLHHFDVSLHPDEPAALLADRNDPAARDRWSMASVDVGAGYSAAVVVEGPMVTVELFDF